MLQPTATNTIIIVSIFNLCRITEEVFKLDALIRIPAENSRDSEFIILHLVLSRMLYKLISKPFKTFWKIEIGC